MFVAMSIGYVQLGFSFWFTAPRPLYPNMQFTRTSARTVMELRTIAV
jgi:hypothetical protein